MLYIIIHEFMKAELQKKRYLNSFMINFLKILLLIVNTDLKIQNFAI